MSQTKDLVQTIISQIPLLIMTIHSGSSIYNLLPIMLIPLIIYLVDKIPGIIRYFMLDRPPKNYVSYYAGNDEHYFGTNVDFIEKTSTFLNEFFPASIKSGDVKSYHLLPYDPNLLFRCYKAIVKPDNSYHHKFSFSEKIDGKNILDKIRATGFVFPEGMDRNLMLKHPIYLSLVDMTEKTMIFSKNGKKLEDVKRTYVKISAINMKVAEQFIYIVINYNLHQTYSVHNFRLQHVMHYCKKEEEHGSIVSYVNVEKNYKNVFLSKNDSEKVVSTISEWENNKIVQLKKGIPNKLAFLFSGKPGCGKSSLIYAIACETKKHIASINMQGFDNNTFISLMSGIDNSIVVFEDIDAYKFTHKRKCESDLTDEEVKVEAKRQFKLAMITQGKDGDYSTKHDLTLDALLEVLDGYNYLNNCIVIMTSNHPEKLDPALVRPGRIDHQINFDYANEHQFRSMFKYFTDKDYRQIDKNFVFTEGKYTSSYLINTVILPNTNKPSTILETLK